MKHNSLMVPRRASWCILAGAVLAATAQAGPVDTDSEHELVVYSVKRYGEWYDLSQTPPMEPRTLKWKDNLKLKPSTDPYQDFFKYLRPGAHIESAHFENEQVTVDQMVSEGEDHRDRGWSESDLVFFLGHNTQIKPQWINSIGSWEPVSGVLSHVIRPEGGGSFSVITRLLSGWQTAKIEPWTTWGTAADPYRYHRNTITDASLSNAYAIFYAHNPLTSVLIGEDFPRTGGMWETENYRTGGQDYRQNTNTLGPETEWVIAHGCNAVTVASENGQHPLELGVNAWRKSWSGLHMALGHYKPVNGYALPDLKPLAMSLRAGNNIKDAYFDAHTDSDSSFGHQSVIAASPVSCCSYEPAGLVCPTIGCGDYLSNDQWKANEMSDLEAGEYYFATEWVVEKL